MTEEQSENTDSMVVEETPSRSSETQHAGQQAEDNMQEGGEQHHPEVKMVSAQTQTQKYKGKDQGTQTPAAARSNKETQTDLPEPKQDELTPEATLQDNKPDEEGASSESTREQDANLNDGSRSEEAGPSGGTSGDRDTRAEKGVKPMSYAKAVSGDGKTEKQSNMAAAKPADESTRTQNTW